MGESAAGKTESDQELGGSLPFHSTDMECHLEGTVAISRPGKHLYDFRPGDTLDEYIRYFVLDDQERRQNPQLSQVEALGQSACRQQELIEARLLPGVPGS